MFKNLILMLTSVVVLSISAVADVPQFINFQGLLLDSTGAPVTDGPYLIKFIIWNDPAATAAANEKWSSGFQNMTVNDGLFEYQLGTSVPLLAGLFSNDTILYLGVTEGTNPEMLPRTKLVSVGYAFHALKSDTADIALSAKSADSSSTVSDNSITSAKIADGSISDADINSSAAISTSKISGTAVNVNSTQTITGNKTFSNFLKIGDSTFWADKNGISIGDASSPSISYLVRIERDFSTTTSAFGEFIRLRNDTLGGLFGSRAIVGSTLGGTGDSYGFYATVDNANASTSPNSP